MNSQYFQKHLHEKIKIEKKIDQKFFPSPNIKTTIYLHNNWKEKNSRLSPDSNPQPFNPQVA